MDTDEKLLASFIQSHTGEVLLIIENLKEIEIADLLESLPIDLSALLLGQMDRFKAARGLEKVDLGIAIQLIEKLPISSAKVLLRQIDHSICNTLLNGLPPHASMPLRRILKYPENSVGAYLNPLVFTLFEDQSIKQGLEKIKKNDPHLQSKIFILDRNQLLVGFIELKELITNDINKPIHLLINSDFPKIVADMNITTLMEGWKYDESFPCLPVVDASGIFLGEITKLILANINPKKNTFDHEALQASSALGELYQIGLSSLFRSASEIVGNQHIK